MHFLRAERTVVAELLPGLDEALAALPLAVLERPGNPALALFRQHGGPGLLIPAEHGGRGATALQAVRVQRALGSRSPSLAIATTMHHFSVATLVEMSVGASSSGFEWLVLEGIARQRLYVASGFAEGRPDTSILSSGIEVRRTEGGLVLSGSKKPCSLSQSMDLLTASIRLPTEDGRPGELAVVIIPAATPGIERRPFWNSPALAGAESEEIVLREVHVPDNLIAHAAGQKDWDHVQERSFLWFELLITASYLGAASALVERVLTTGRGTPCERALPAIEVEAAMAAVEGVARAIMAGERGPDLLARALFVRFAVQSAVERAAACAAELLGGMAFVTAPDVALLLASVRALAFHPPSRGSISPALDCHLNGGTLRVE
ncbi:MAG TPA: acyl-CoA dehydrogenase family protein [Gemmataceae bacterium]